MHHVAITIEELESPWECVRFFLRLSSTTEAYPPEFIAAQVPSTSGSPCTSSLSLTTLKSSTLMSRGARALRMASATLQSCIGRYSLVYHIGCAHCLPSSLHDALDNPRLIFANVQISFDVGKLSKDYGLQVELAVDMAKLTTKETNRREVKRAGLTTSARELKGQDPEILR